MAFGSEQGESLVLSDEPWNDVICITSKMKKVPCLKIGVLGNCDVGKSSLSQNFALREAIDGISKVKTTGIDMFNCYLKINC